MKNSIILITKDALSKNYLPVYGNRIWSTPNMDELASKGTIFNKFYTAAPSSVMSYLSMFTGEYPYKGDKKRYAHVKEQYKEDTLFDKAYRAGYQCHIIWDEHWIDGAKKYSECYGQDTIIHSLNNLRQGVGAHYIHEGTLERSDNLAEDTISRIEEEVKNICGNEKRVFLWIHLPHVINGRIAYGDDIDLFDRIVGIMRRYFIDENIFISADHGNMNGHKNKLGYGFDVYEPAICIPMISPRIEDFEHYNENTINIDLFDIIFNRKIKQREFLYSDTAYYAQPHRKLAIIHNNFKYIYNKKDNSEELYDLNYDPTESCNLISDMVYDVDRKVNTPLRELYFYPNWDLVEDMRIKLRNEKNRIWREENLSEKIFEQTREILKTIYRKTRKLRKK